MKESLIPVFIPISQKYQAVNKLRNLVEPISIKRGYPGISTINGREPVTGKIYYDYPIRFKNGYPPLNAKPLTGCVSSRFSDKMP